VPADFEGVNDGLDSLFWSSVSKQDLLHIAGYSWSFSKNALETRDFNSRTKKTAKIWSEKNNGSATRTNIQKCKMFQILATLAEGKSAAWEKEW